MPAKLTFIFCLLFVVLALNQVSGDQVPASEFEPERKLRPQDCHPRCVHRCSKTSHRKPCMFFCQKCCAKCLCVPPGTQGNKKVCPCYNNWKTKKGGPKCP